MLAAIDQHVHARTYLLVANEGTVFLYYYFLSLTNKKRDKDNYDWCRENRRPTAGMRHVVCLR